MLNRLARAGAHDARVRALLVAVGLFLTILFVYGALRFAEARSDTGAIRAALKTNLRSKNLSRLVHARGGDASRRVLRFYRDRHFRPAWVNGAGAGANAGELVAAILDAEDEGLSEKDYRTVRIRELLHEAGVSPLRSKPDPARLAELDLLLTYTFLVYARDLLSGHIDPRALPAGWHTRPRQVDWDVVLDDAIRGAGPKRALDRLEPRHAGYKRLRGAFHRYVKIAKQGGWPAVPSGPTLRTGARGERVVALRARLAVTDDLGPGAGKSPRYDHLLEAAVRRFQERHGLAPSGQVDAETLAALNVPVEERIRQIVLNLERWRWLPNTLGDRYVLVNVPEFMLHLVRAGRVRESMRVVVGKEYNRTPIFSDTLTHIVFRPYWNVPVSIARSEIAEHVERDPDYLTRNGIRVFDGEGDNAREVDPSDLAWGGLSDEGSSYFVRQAPGPGNPLGRVKFMFPNRFQVYLHDTPSERLFARNERDFSHGCIRIEKPDVLAAYLLDGSWSKKAIRAAMEAKESRTVRVPHPIPVHILYWTAWVDESGSVEFRDDLYGIDRVLERALRSRAFDPEKDLEASGAGQPPGLKAPRRNRMTA